MKFLLAVSLLILPLAAGAQTTAASAPTVDTANQVLAVAGLPGLPAKAQELKCYAWNGLSAGVYATWTMTPDDLAGYLSAFRGLETTSPIPTNLLAPPNSAAPWFSPGSLDQGEVWFRGRITRAAPELFRLYVNREKGAVALFYTWNNKGIYP